MDVKEILEELHRFDSISKVTIRVGDSWYEIDGVFYNYDDGEVNIVGKDLNL